jgi:hypothetical protein
MVKLDRLELVGLGIASMLVIFALWNFLGGVGSANVNNGPNTNAGDVKVDSGSITVSVKYIGKEVGRAAFYIALDTHRGDLFEYDLMELSELQVNGKSFKAVNWTESPQSWGHHRKGILEFPDSAKVEIENAKNFRLIVKIGKDRIFEWGR